MTEQPDTAPVKIHPSEKQHLPIAFGGYWFDPEYRGGKQDDDLLAAMEAALQRGITHFDTASEYGDGHSERLVGRFIAAKAGRREQIFLASKYQSDEVTVKDMLNAIDASLSRLQTDVIDLYYIHWPRSGKDMRRWMEALETARQQGKIRAIGVSNFSIENMEQVSEVGTINAHQLPYNLVWRFAEREIIPYCVEHNIAVLTYSSIGHSILTGRYGREFAFPEGDGRRTVILFNPDVWPQVYEGVEAFKQIAQRTGRPLIHLALRWLLHRRGVTSVVVGSKNAQQAVSNMQALEGEIPDSVFEELTAMSDRLMQRIPDEGNPYAHHP